MLLPVTSRAADLLYENFGNVFTAPVIDATNFLNHGTFNIATATLQPFETYDTLNYTNDGTMISSVGWRFEHTPTYAAGRRMANSFVNFNPGTIEAVDAFFSNPSLPCSQALSGSSYLFIGATNITTGAGFPADGASLTVGAGGWMQLVGENVDVSNSGLQVLPVWLAPSGSFFFPPGIRTNFIPDVAVYDLYSEVGGYSDRQPLFSGNLWDGNVADAQGGTNTPGFSMSSTISDSYVVEIDPFDLSLTNFTGPPDNVTGEVVVKIRISTNIFKHAVFAAAQPQFITEVGFGDSVEAGNPFRTAAVLFTTTITNVVTGARDGGFINGYDSIAADSLFRSLSTNILGCAEPTTKPMNFEFSRLSGLRGTPNVPRRVPPADFFTATGYKLRYPTNIYIDAVTNSVVGSGVYGNYACLYDNILIRPPAIAGGNETNYQGRIRIYADALNLENTRIRGEGQVILQSDHLISSQNAIVDSENISFKLSSASGSLKIKSIVPDQVQRLRGAVQAWSAVWTNTAVVWATNYSFTNVGIATPPGSTNFVTNVFAIFDPITNEISTAYSATMIGGDGLSTFFPVNVFDAGASARDIIIDDNMSVVRSFKISGRSLTLNGDLTFPGFYPPDPVTGASPPEPVLEDWSTAVAPSLQYFTNNGNLSIANRAIFGTDRVSPYAAFINHAGISSAGFRLRSDYFENSGSIISQSDIEMKGQIGKLEGGDSTSASITRFEINKLKFNQYQILSSGKLILSIADDLSDAGSGSANLFLLTDGFQMESKPKKGDLIGTTFSLNAPANAISDRMDSTWAGEDRGASAAGYVNNAAIGQLVLTGTNHPQSSFRFAGAGGGQRALYVDLLDLTDLGTDYATRLLIQPNMVIYFAAAKLGFTPPPNSNNIPVLPEEFLDGKFSGRLRWVKTFAGPNSSTPVVINGQTHIVNSALFNSHIIDSDGDGVPNFDDGVLPANGDKFKAAPITVTVNGNGSLAPNHNGQSLLIGLTYSMVALPADGASFTGWTGSIPSASPTLTFVMQSNLNVTANFSYAAVAGAYRGLFYEPAGVQFLKSGAFQAATTAQRGISGSLQIGKNKHSFKGTLSAAGTATILIPRSGNTTLTLNVLAGFEQITGTVGDGTWTANLVADRAVYSKANPTGLAGKYTLSIPGNGNEADTTTPHGDGFGAVTLSTAGGVSLKGSLADGSKISQSSAISKAGQWPLYTSLYAGGGQLLGWMTFANSGGGDIEGPLSWFKKPNPVASFYPAGFDVEPNGIGSRYDSTLSPATGFVDGFVSFTGGNLTMDFMNDVAFAAGNKVVNLSPNKLTFKLKTDGTFSGSAVNPSTGRSLKYSGALLQKQGVGGGYFLGTDQSGKVLVAP